VTSYLSMGRKVLLQCAWSLFDKKDPFVEVIAMELCHVSSLSKQITASGLRWSVMVSFYIFSPSRGITQLYTRLPNDVHPGTDHTSEHFEPSLGPAKAKLIQALPRKFPVPPLPMIISNPPLASPLILAL
jgi:hypothetical protein